MVAVAAATNVAAGSAAGALQATGCVAGCAATPTSAAAAAVALGGRGTRGWLWQLCCGGSSAGELVAAEYGAGAGGHHNLWQGSPGPERAALGTARAAAAGHARGCIERACQVALACTLPLVAAACRSCSYLTFRWEADLGSAVLGERADVAQAQPGAQVMGRWRRGTRRQGARAVGCNGGGAAEAAVARILD
jgi:hypothetical protein